MFIAERLLVRVLGVPESWEDAEPLLLFDAVVEIQADDTEYGGGTGYGGGEGYETRPSAIMWYEDCVDPIIVSHR